MLIDLDLEGVEPAVYTPYEPVPEGTYTLIVDVMSVKLPKEEGKSPQFEISFQIDGEDNKKIRHWIALSEGGKPFIVQFLQSIFSASEFPTSINVSTDEEAAEFCASFVGMTCQAVITVNPQYNDPKKKTNKIQEFLPRAA